MTVHSSASYDLHNLVCFLAKMQWIWGGLQISLFPLIWEKMKTIFWPWNLIFLSDFCCCLVAQSCLTFCDPVDFSTPGFLVLHHLLEFAQTHVHRVGDAMQPSHPLSSLSPPALSLSQQQGLFQWVGSSHQVAKVLGYFSFSISSSNEYSGLIPLRIDWFDLLAVQGTLKSLLQHHSSKALILQLSAFSMVQRSQM